VPFFMFVILIIIVAVYSFILRCLWTKNVACTQHTHRIEKRLKSRTL
jgi:hypothetical protein